MVRKYDLEATQSVINYNYCPYTTKNVYLYICTYTHVYLFIYFGKLPNFTHTPSFQRVIVQTVQGPN